MSKRGSFVGVVLVLIVLMTAPIVTVETRVSATTLQYTTLSVGGKGATPGELAEYFNGLIGVPLPKHPEYVTVDLVSVSITYEGRNAYSGIAVFTVVTKCSVSTECQ